MYARINMRWEAIISARANLVRRAHSHTLARKYAHVNNCHLYIFSIYVDSLSRKKRRKYQGQCYDKIRWTRKKTKHTRRTNTPMCTRTTKNTQAVTAPVALYTDNGLAAATTTTAQRRRRQRWRRRRRQRQLPHTHKMRTNKQRWNTRTHWLPPIFAYNTIQI